MHSAALVLLFCNYCGNPIHKANECNIPSEDFFCDYCGKEGFRKLFVLPSSWNRNNSDYNSKIYQHFSLPLNQKPKHFNLPLRFSPPMVILVSMLKKKHNVDKREVFQAHAIHNQTL